MPFLLCHNTRCYLCYHTLLISVHRVYNMYVCACMYDIVSCVILLRLSLAVYFLQCLASLSNNHCFIKPCLIATCSVICFDFLRHYHSRLGHFRDCHLHRVADNRYRYSSATPLQKLTCHIGSHSVTCYPTEVTLPPLPQPKLVLD